MTACYRRAYEIVAQLFRIARQMAPGGKSARRAAVRGQREPVGPALGSEAATGTGKPRLRIKAAMPGSRPRKFRYPSAGSTVLPALNTLSCSRLATALSYGPPCSMRSEEASAESVSDHR